MKRLSIFRSWLIIVIACCFVGRNLVNAENEDEMCLCSDHVIDCFFQRVFIINLDSRPDRWENITRAMAFANITNYERFSAIVGSPDDPRLAPLKKTVGPKNYVESAGGCLLSHIAVSNIAWSRGLSRILVLEDDCVFHKDINQLLPTALQQVPQDWLMLYFSANHIDKPERYSTNVLHVKKAVSAHAYGIVAEGIQSVVNNAVNVGAEIDVFFHTLQATGRVYQITPNLIGQASGFSDIQKSNVNYGHLRVENPYPQFPGL